MHDCMYNNKYVHVLLCVIKIMYNVNGVTLQTVFFGVGGLFIMQTKSARPRRNYVAALSFANY